MRWPNDLTDECGSHIAANGRFVDIIRVIGGSPHILLDVDSSSVKGESESASSDSDEPETATSPSTTESASTPVEEVSLPAAAFPTPSGPKPIFVGHGKNKEPLQQLQRLLTTFQRSEERRVGKEWSSRW